MKKSNSMLSILNDLNANFETYLLDNKIKTRNGASPGLWLCFVLPIAVVLGFWNHPNCSHLYRTSTCLSVGLLLSSLTIVFQVNHSTQFRTACCAINSITTTLLLNFFSHHSLITNSLYGILSSFGFSKLLLKALEKFPESFTFGEAAVVVEAAVLFLASFFGMFTVTPVTCIDISTTILQVGLTGLYILCISVYYIPQLRSPVEFYTAFGVTLVSIVVMLHVLLGFNPIVWTVSFVFEDMLMVSGMKNNLKNLYQIKLLVSWILFAALAVTAAATQVKSGQKATTVVRKYFHLLALLVYLPGLVLKPCFLYLASGVIFAILIGLEMVRLIKLPHVGEHLDAVFGVFGDEKDSWLVLTHIYLLGGCSAPLWLHPAPSEGPAVLLPLAAGVLAVGVGDAAASVCGSLCGNRQWPDSKKTKEGSAACFISQLFLVIALIHFGYIPRNNLLQPIVAIAVVSLVEATTDQIDNLALPLVMYLFLL